MLNHDTQERKSGKVVIGDLGPDSLQQFLEHLYTRRMEAISYESAFGLYTSADKYAVQSLKSDCLEYMQRTLSVDSFCDVMTLALRYHEEKLVEVGRLFRVSEECRWKFFKKNRAKVIRTVKWQMFMGENSTQANELLIKAIAVGRNQQ